MHMHKSTLCLFLLSWFSLSGAMDAQQQDLLFRLCDLPPEIVGVIVACGTLSCKEYPIENMKPAYDNENDHGVWCIPTTLRLVEMCSSQSFRKEKMTDQLYTRVL